MILLGEGVSANEQWHSVLRNSTWAHDITDRSLIPRSLFKATDRWQHPFGFLGLVRLEDRKNLTWVGTGGSYTKVLPNKPRYHYETQ
jgi:hypothetical protein